MERPMQPEVSLASKREACTWDAKDLTNGLNPYGSHYEAEEGKERAKNSRHKVAKVAHGRGR
eukprot:scaffold406364_cov13-Prasinocladus_malaysianus.AAC.1